MFEFILHIGRHKSGTTSIQRFLAKNRDKLKRQSYLYPEYFCKNDAHHDLTSLLKSDKKRKIAQVLQMIEEEAQQASCSKIILSTETFQQFHKPDYLLEFFPKKHTSVISYVRNPIEYFISTYQQKVQASKIFCTPSQYEQLFKLSLVNYINSWKSAYGEKLSLRLFSRHNLLNSDVIEDFCFIAGIDSSELEKINNQNVSIAGNLLLYKLALNRVYQNRKMPNKALHDELERIARERKEFTGKISISNQLLWRLKERFAQDLDILTNEFNCSFDLKSYSVSPLFIKTFNIVPDFTFIHQRLMDLDMIDVSLENIFQSLDELLVEIF